MAELKQIYARIRGDKYLAFMDTQIYPEWEELMAGAKVPPRVIMWLPNGAEQRRAGFYICNQMLQLMESVHGP